MHRLVRCIIVSEFLQYSNTADTQKSVFHFAWEKTATRNKKESCFHSELKGALFGLLSPRVNETLCNTHC